MNTDAINQLITNDKNVNNIQKFVDYYWTPAKSGKRDNAKDIHFEILKNTLIGNPKNAFIKIPKTKIELNDECEGLIQNILKDYDLDDVLSSTYINKALKTVMARPAIGRGEFLFASLFSNIGFAKSKGDLVEITTGKKIELKGEDATIGDGQNEEFKTLNKAILHSIFAHFNTNADAFTLFNKPCAQKLKELIGINKDAMKLVFNALQNLRTPVPALTNQAIKCYIEHKYLLRTVAAMHLLTYLNKMGATYFLALNDTKYKLFRAPNTVEEAYQILENFKVDSWEIGNSGVKITLK